MRLNFGKHRDKTCDEIERDDPVYVDWLLKVQSDNPYFRRAQEEFKRLREEKQRGTQQQQRQRLPWWDVLEVSPQASADEVKAGFRRQMSLYHPDKVAQLGVELRELAHRKTQDINAALKEAERLR